MELTTLVKMMLATLVTELLRVLMPARVELATRLKMALATVAIKGVGPREGKHGF